MAPKTTPPFRADHVGSLLRPERLLKARAEHAEGKIDDAQLRNIEDDSIRDVVRMQEEVGLQSATDGEHRRGSWHMDFIYQLGGVTKVQDELKVTFHNENEDIEFTPSGLKVTEPIRSEHTIFEDAFTFLRDTVTRNTPKLTIPSPSMVHYRGGSAAISPDVYPDQEQFWADLSAAYAAQVRALGDLGCTYLQLDDTSLAYLNDPSQRSMIDQRGDNGDQLHTRYIRQFNAALADRPSSMNVTTHMCRGNFRSSWVASGGYEHVAEELFNELDVDGFFLEFDDERSGGFEPLRFVPEGKYVVLGLVTTKKGELESKDELKRRIEQASKHVPLEQLCLSPQCGFSSTFEGNDLSYEEQVAKLRLIVETAEEVWG
ncbi:5-methyltetrahydropteroyltriglutamate--homocysteine S-methyltransferase [Nocardiopsis sp. HNM0947]|uniref:5-methyltetrahydropteroyltriglutamate--homocysteine S-methyltransferase n=1 Tax=Nocardiopsis coralli TaxID=2772213 RepID=A0ABR9P8I4_9ACTN|nr:5-methyltetrahydropteroyltriglutamate--homocysteine S-methyltransferase [Nocardiopsis coralli]MBE3000145.1 5-methyltetrahydropteroyltriglutamate--homocysteine S-methyltransferase [Nocardiopsis coralli]